MMRAGDQHWSSAACVIERSYSGIASGETTNVYAEIGLEIQGQGDDAVRRRRIGTGRPWKETSGLIAFLNAM